MSVKENVDYIKEEISTQESFIENFFKLEKFYKKYKKAIYVFIGLIIVSILVKSILYYMNEQTKYEANIAFNKIIENPDDTQSLNTLQEKNKKLYNIALYLKGDYKNIDIKYLDTLAQYAIAVDQNNIENISKTIQNQEFIQKDFAILNRAILETKNKKYAKAKKSLKMIGMTSPVYNLAKVLEHHLVTK